MMIEKDEKIRGLVGWKTVTRMAWSVFVLYFWCQEGKTQRTIQKAMRVRQ